MLLHYIYENCHDTLLCARGYFLTDSAGLDDSFDLEGDEGTPRVYVQDEMLAARKLDIYGATRRVVINKKQKKMCDAVDFRRRR